MTPQLRALIDRATCDRCAGNGKLANSHTTTTVIGEVPHHWIAPCEKCHETGVNLAALAAPDLIEHRDAQGRLIGFITPAGETVSLTGRLVSHHFADKELRLVTMFAADPQPEK